MAITFVTGSFPPDICGVGDYTAQLKNALDQSGVNTHTHYSSQWRLGDIWRRWRELRDSKGLLLLQHPTGGFEKRLAPFLIWPLLIGKNKAVTLHEFSRKSVAGKLLCYCFFMFSEKLIFTTETERKYAIRFAPWIARFSKTIPIGSNIPFAPSPKKETDVAYFGLIFPGKGLEDFLDIVTQVVSKHRPLRIKVMGQISRGAEDFAAKIFAKLELLGASIVLNADTQTVAKNLAGSQTVLLPFPDGISMRRGSALAAFGNGALVITTSTETEKDTFEGLCLMGENNSELAQLLIAAIENPENYRPIADAGQRYAQSYDWRNIAEQHIEFLSTEKARASI